MDDDPKEKPLEMHVYPTGDDRRQHEMVSTCWCRPKRSKESPHVWLHNHGPNGA